MSQVLIQDTGRNQTLKYRKFSRFTNCAHLLYGYGRIYLIVRAVVNDNVPISDADQDSATRFRAF